MNYNPKESEEQAFLFKWAEIESALNPKLNLMFHIPNGGSRQKIEAINLKKQGVKAGVPDIFLACPSKKFHGLFIELKRRGGSKPRTSQLEWLNELNKAGYKTAVCYGADEAIEIINEYLKQ